MRLFPRRGSRRVDSPREQDLARRIDQTAPAVETSVRPLQLNSSPFSISVADYLKAAAGPPAWSRRLVRIQNLQNALREQLDVAWREHSLRFAAQPQARAAAWRAYVGAIDLAPLNDLIEKHNAYYPIEARLRMQWPSGRYLLPTGAQYPLEHVIVDALLEEYPPDVTREG